MGKDGCGDCQGKDFGPDCGRAKELGAPFDPKDVSGVSAAEALGAFTMGGNRSRLVGAALGMELLGALCKG